MVIFFSDWNSGRNCSRILYASLKKYMCQYSGWHFWYVWNFTAWILGGFLSEKPEFASEFLKHSKRIQKLLQSKFLNIFFFAASFNCLSGKSDSPYEMIRKEYTPAKAFFVCMGQHCTKAVANPYFYLLSFIWEYCTPSTITCSWIQTTLEY